METVKIAGGGTLRLPLALTEPPTPRQLIDQSTCGVARFQVGLQLQTSPSNFKFTDLADQNSERFSNQEEPGAHFDHRLQACGGPRRLQGHGPLIP